MPVQTTPIHIPLGTALTLGSGLTVVDVGVSISADAGSGIFSDQSDVTLINHGAVSTGGGFPFGAAFVFNGSGDTIVNADDGTASGQVGAFLNGPSIKLINFGSFFNSLAGVFVSTEADSITIDNRGSIYSTAFGVVLSAPAGPIAIANSGYLEGGSSAIELAAAALTTATNSGTLKGGTFAIEQSVGATGGLNLTNSGQIIGGIHLIASAADDRITNSGAIGGAVYLSGGSDLFKGTGGTSGALFGQAGNDVLIGGRSNDTLIGGPGKDLLNGQTGRDTFDFNLAAESQGANADTIQGFSHAQGDHIDLRTIDATPAGINNAFLFAGSQSFATFNATHNGGVVRAVAGVVQVDIGGNGTVDMVIKTPGVTLHATDFFL